MAVQSQFAKRARRPRQLSRAAREAIAPHYPAGAVAAYRMGLRGAVKQLEDAVALVAEQEPMLRLDGVDDFVNRLRTYLSGLSFTSAFFDQVEESVAKKSARDFQRLDINLRTDPGIGAAMDDWRSRQVAKIRSLVDFEVKQIGQLLRKNEGLEPRALRSLIQERFGVTRAKADLLARDQVLTLNAKVTETRAKNAGIEEYIWTTSGDDRVRDIHKDLDGKRFRFDDPPPISKNGRRGNPGDDYQCRCTAFLIIPEDNDEEEPSPLQATPAPQPRPVTIAPPPPPPVPAAPRRPTPPPRFESPEAWIAAIPAPQKQSVEFWSKGGFRAMRLLDAGKKLTAEAIDYAGVGASEIKKQFKAMRQALKRAPLYTGEVQRGIGGLSDAEIQSLTTIGTEVVPDAMASWTKNPGVAEEFAKRTTSVYGTDGRRGTVVMHLAPKSRAHDITQMSEIQFEEEVLVTRGARYRVQSSRVETKKHLLGYDMQIHHVYLAEE